MTLRTFIPCGSPVWFVPAFIKLQLSTLAVAVEKALLGCHNFLLYGGTLLWNGRSLVNVKRGSSAAVHDAWSDLHWHAVTRAAVVSLGSAEGSFSPM